jgi:hypothetical protein
MVTDERILQVLGTSNRGRQIYKLCRRIQNEAGRSEDLSAHRQDDKGSRLLETSLHCNRRNRATHSTQLMEHGEKLRYHPQHLCPPHHRIGIHVDDRAGQTLVSVSVKSCKSAVGPLQGSNVLITTDPALKPDIMQHVFLNNYILRTTVVCIIFLNKRRARLIVYYLHLSWYIVLLGN